MTDFYKVSLSSSSSTSTSSNTENDDECLICFKKLDNDVRYAMIDHIDENGKFCVECLEKWLDKSKCGLITNDKINSYSIYEGNKLIITMPIVYSDIKEDDNINNNINNKMVIIRDSDNNIIYIGDNESESDSLYDAYTNDNTNHNNTCCMLILCAILMCVIIVCGLSIHWMFIK